MCGPNIYTGTGIACISEGEQFYRTLCKKGRYIRIFWHVGCLLNVPSEALCLAPVIVACQIVPSVYLQENMRELLPCFIHVVSVTSSEWILIIGTVPIMFQNI